MRACLPSFAFALPLVLLPITAWAHFDLTEPKAADKSTNGGKGPSPCGPTADSGIVTSVQGGTEITVSVTETVTHPGFYRVALATSRNLLPADNVVKDKDGKVLPPAGPGNSASAEFQASPRYPVLADNLFPHTDGSSKMFSQKIMLPNMNCDKCTLQVIEFMAQHGPPYFYYHCADLKITADPAKPIFDPTASAGGSGGTGGRGGAGGAAGAGGMGGTTGGAPGASGSPSGGAPTAGAPTAGASTAGAPTAGAPTAGMAGSAGSASAPSAPAAPEESGCNVSGSSGGATSLLSALGLSLILLRRRRGTAE